MPSSSSEPKASASASRPVDLAARRTSWSRVSNCLASFGWTVKPSGGGRQRVVDRVERRRGRRRSRRGAARRSAAAAAWRARSSSGGAACGSRRAPPAGGCWKSSSACLGLLERDVAPLDERLGVELAHRAPGVDALVHQRLGVARVVALVVAVAAVADHVDHDVLVELLAVRERQPGHPHAGLGVVAVHVEDRRLDHLGDVGASTPTSGPTRAGW